MGISLYPNDGHSVEDLLKHADAAMYQAKHSGKNRYHFFTPELNQQILDQLKLEHDMRRALARGEFRVHYQPRVHLQSKRVDSVEALLRWSHPTQGPISPATFIPLAEKTGLILPLTRYVLQTACAQAKAWQTEGRNVRIAINLSAKCLQHADLLSMLQEPLEFHQLEAQYLELEITESAAMEDVEGNIKTLNQLKDLGFYISVDDFGTAYSSLNYLKRLPISCLKIDRSFIKDISLKTLDSADTAIVKAIVALGKALDFHLVAEGVETPEQVSFLQFLKCDEAQGFFFCKPLPPEDLFKTDRVLSHA
jgi:EAL domain-containing protein (putative c-di-GMP-specific phosphodiesterase class I)